MPRLPLIITPGDPDGIGPEITWKSLKAIKRTRSGSWQSPFLCVGAEAPFRKLRAPVVLYQDGVAAPRRKGPYVWLLPAPAQAPEGRFLPGFQCGWSIEKAVQLIQSGQGSALVTGPISKERLQKGGFLFPGHTEMLAQLTATPRVTMMLANPLLRVSLATIHVSIQNLPKSLTEKEVFDSGRQTLEALQREFGIRRPHLAVLSFNPHAGENGLFGDEESRIIRPAMAKLSEKFGKAATLSGPHPADTFFARELSLPKTQRADAVLAMYHDQGLTPVKLVDFARTVNVTLGMPIIRTSVDHGTGFDIAGKGIADPSSLQAALDLARKLVSSRL